MAGREQDPPHPIFIGGSARSGTHVVGRLLASDNRYHLIQTEARFHCAKGGLCDVVRGKTDVDEFAERCLGQWWQRGLRQHLGLQVLIDRSELETALSTFAKELRDDKLAAGRALIHSVMSPTTEAEGRSSWIDVSGTNVIAAPVLAKILPDAHFVHMLRDGRATAVGILRKRDTTDDRAEALNHWTSRVRRAHKAISALPSDAVLTVRLEDLASRRRDETLADLTKYLNLEDSGSIRHSFEHMVQAERAHVDTWRERVAPPDARWIDRHYRRTVRKLRQEGISWVPQP